MVRMGLPRIDRERSLRGPSSRPRPNRSGQPVAALARPTGALAGVSEAVARLLDLATPDGLQAGRGGGEADEAPAARGQVEPLEGGRAPLAREAQGVGVEVDP